MEGDGSQGGFAGEVLSNLVNEVVKTVVVLNGADPISASVMGGAAGGVVKGIEPAILRWRRRRQRRLAIVTDSMRNVVGDDLDRLLEAALDDDRKLDLIARVLEVAQRTADENRVRFYGRIAAQGVLEQDDAKVDAADRIFSSIAALDAVDLKVLLHMSADSGQRWCKRTEKGKPQEEGGGPSLASEIPKVEPVLDAVVARLENLGLINGNFGSNFLSKPAEWQITDFGLLCVAELRGDSS